MNKKVVTILLVLFGILTLSACNLPGIQDEGETILAKATATSLPTAAPAETKELPTPTSTEAPEPTQEPSPVPTEPVGISIDNAKELTLQTRLQFELDVPVAALDLSYDSRYLVVSHRWEPENAVGVWDLGDETRIQSLTFHKKDVVTLSFSPNGNLMASGSLDGTVALWEVGSWELVDDFLAIPQGVASLAFSPDNSLLAVGGYRNQLKIRRLADGEWLHHYDGAGPHVPNKVAFTKDGSEYYADTGYADVTAWSTANGELLRSFRGEACIGGFDLSSDETRLAYSSSCAAAQAPHDPLAAIAVRDVASGEALLYGAFKDVSTRVIYTKDDTLILTNSGTTIRFWDAADGSLYHQLPYSGYYVEFMLADDGSLLIIGDADGDVLIYGLGP